MCVNDCRDSRANASDMLLLMRLIIIVIILVMKTMMRMMPLPRLLGFSREFSNVVGKVVDSLSPPYECVCV